MSEWRKTLIRGIRDDYLARGEKSCIYRHIFEEAKANARVRLKWTWAKGLDAEDKRLDTAKLLAEIAIHLKKPSSVGSLKLLLSTTQEDAKAKNARELNALLREGLRNAQANPPLLSPDELTRIAREVCLASGKVGKDTSVQALCALCDYRAGKNALIVGDEQGELVTSEAEGEKELKLRISGEAEQKLYDLGLPKNEESVSDNPRVSNVPTKLVELALLEIDGLVEALKGHESSVFPVANGEAEANGEDLRIVMKAARLQGDVIVPVATDGLTGLSLCILGKEFAPELMYLNKRPTSGLMNRPNPSKRRTNPGAPFFAVVPQIVLNHAVVNEEQWSKECGYSPSYGMTKLLKKNVQLVWEWGAYEGRDDPIEHFEEIVRPQRPPILECYRKFNSVVPDGCPERFKLYFECR